MVNPFQHIEEAVVQFGAGDSVLGITEVEHEVFVAVTCRFDLATSKARPGSAAAWKVDMNVWVADKQNAVTLVANLTDIGLPDGVVALNGSNSVLIADAAKALIWKLDTISGDYTIILEDDILFPSNPQLPQLPLGVDGLHILNDYLYFTNLGDNILCRVAVDNAGNPTDEIDLIATMPFPDNFALTANGTAYVVGANQLYRVSPAGEIDVLARGLNSTLLEGATSAHFRRTPKYDGVLYIGRVTANGPRVRG
ncbi:hypothetical protein LTR62_004363 [Meristemomyces frigidus]|uniref:SMP-30/Gluconolactonase/LRE-like region domain-containing protein n=1 Tax=Meristemomyces frigidus TaxID=1508187 RepID=A0AAN7TEV2_9PEZI|nr:hypothetical protein LTR62_004363 [Meristemomyces frigidus]